MWGERARKRGEKGRERGKERKGKREMSTVITSSSFMIPPLLPVPALSDKFAAILCISEFLSVTF